MPQEITTRKRSGLIFKPGDFGAVTSKDDIKAGKKGIYTEADMEKLAQSVTSSVPVRMGHNKTLLEGKLGNVSSAFVGFDESGQKVLMGEWEEPEPLAQLLGETRRTLSAEIDPLTMTLHAVALEVNPHIKDAAFFSEAVEQAFAQFSRGEEVTTLAEFRFETEKERDLIDDTDFGDVTQKLFPARTQDEFRDSMRELANADDPTAVKKRLLEIGERKGYEPERFNYWRTPGISQPLGADCLSCYSAENPTMKFFTRNKTGDLHLATAEQVVAFSGGFVGPDTKDIFVQEEGGSPKVASPEQVVAFTAGAVKFSAAPATVSPEIQARLDRLAQFEANEQATFAHSINEKAEAAYEALLKEGKAIPADKETLVAAFTVAHQFDSKKTELAYFAADDAGTKDFSMGKFLSDELAKRPVTNLDKEQTSAIGTGALAVFDQEKSTVTGKQGEKKPLATQILETAAKQNAAGSK